VRPRRSETPPALEILEDRCLLDGVPIIPNLPQTFLSASTVPSNGDVNPYGVAFVPSGFSQAGPLHAGDILVSNFNNSGNLQGTGTTIVDISPTGQRTLFFHGSSAPGALGLTTALGVLKSGFVIVGSVPTVDGTSSTIQAPGSLLILNSHGHVVRTLRNSALLDGPWDLTINDQSDQAQLFVSNVLSGTVTRIDLRIPQNADPVVTGETQIASGYLIRTDPAALIIGPTGLAYDAVNDILYVASTGDNAIFAIARAGARTTDARKGAVVYDNHRHLHGPLALTLTPNGDLITANGDAVNPDPRHPSELVEFTPDGRFVAQLSIDSSAGSAFGLAVESSENQIHLAAVDDTLNMLDIWTINLADSPSGMRQMTSRTAAGLSTAVQALDLVLNMHVATAATETPAMLAVFDATLMGQLSDAAAMADQPLSFASHSAPVHDAVYAVLHAFPEKQTGLIDSADA
jgi:hypothetical protein